MHEHVHRPARHRTFRDAVAQVDPADPAVGVRGAELDLAIRVERRARGRHRADPHHLQDVAQVQRVEPRVERLPGSDAEVAQAQQGHAGAGNGQRIRAGFEPGRRDAQAAVCEFLVQLERPIVALQFEVEIAVVVHAPAFGRQQHLGAQREPGIQLDDQVVLSALERHRLDRQARVGPRDQAQRFAGVGADAGDMERAVVGDGDEERRAAVPLVVLLPLHGQIEARGPWAMFDESPARDDRCRLQNHVAVVPAAGDRRAAGAAHEPPDAGQLDAQRDVARMGPWCPCQRQRHAPLAVRHHGLPPRALAARRVVDAFDTGQRLSSSVENARGRVTLGRATEGDGHVGHVAVTARAHDLFPLLQPPPARLHQPICPEGNAAEGHRPVLGKALSDAVRPVRHQRRLFLGESRHQCDLAGFLVVQGPPLGIAEVDHDGADVAQDQLDLGLAVQRAQGRRERRRSDRQEQRVGAMFTPQDLQVADDESSVLVGLPNRRTVAVVLHGIGPAPLADDAERHVRERPRRGVDDAHHHLLVAHHAHHDETGARVVQAHAALAVEVILATRDLQGGDAAVQADLAFGIGHATLAELVEPGEQVAVASQRLDLAWGGPATRATGHHLGAGDRRTGGRVDDAHEDAAGRGDRAFAGERRGAPWGDGQRCGVAFVARADRAGSGGGGVANRAPQLVALRQRGPAEEGVRRLTGPPDPTEPERDQRGQSEQRGQDDAVGPLLGHVVLLHAGTRSGSVEIMRVDDAPDNRGRATRKPWRFAKRRPNLVRTGAR